MLLFSLIYFTISSLSWKQKLKEILKSKKYILYHMVSLYHWVRQSGKWCNLLCVTPCTYTSMNMNKQGTYTVMRNGCHTNSSASKQKHEAWTLTPGGSAVLSFSALHSRQTFLLMTIRATAFFTVHMFWTSKSTLSVQTTS